MRKKNSKKWGDGMNRNTYEAIAVKMLGEEIGYGNLMEWASALWRKELKEKGIPANGAFIPKIAELSPEQKAYDEMVERIFAEMGK